MTDNTGVFPVTPATPTAFETRRLGQVLEFEPTVSQDNLTVNLNVLADFSEFAGFINYGTPIRGSAGPAVDPNTGQVSGSILTQNEILMPVFDSIKETTNVTVWDGQSIAIGGFITESIVRAQDKIPFVGDLPFLGTAFRSSQEQIQKRGLIIFVSVNLVDPGGNPINRRLEDETRPQPPARPTLPPPAFIQTSAPIPAK